MRISDWSSDVCSSDLDRLAENEEPGGSRDGHHPADDEHVAAGPGGNARHQQPASDHGLAVRTLFLHQGHGRISPPPLAVLPFGPVHLDRKNTRLNYSHYSAPRMQSSALHKQIILNILVRTN